MKASLFHFLSPVLGLFSALLGFNEYLFHIQKRRSLSDKRISIVGSECFRNRLTQSTKYRVAVSHFPFPNFFFCTNKEAAVNVVVLPRPDLMYPDLSGLLLCEVTGVVEIEDQRSDVTVAT